MRSGLRWWEFYSLPDAGGTFVGSSYCYATAREWAQFELLYLNDGVWQAWNYSR
jgi:hypothetical protein